MGRRPSGEPLGRRGRGADRRRHDRRRQRPAGTAGGDTDRTRPRARARASRHQGAGRPRRFAGRIGDRLRARSGRAILAARARGFRSSSRWARSRRRAAIGSRPAGDVIFAEPSTITGSIGVFGILPSSRARCRSSASAPTAWTTTRSPASPNLLRGPSPEASHCSRWASRDLPALRHARRRCPPSGAGAGQRDRQGRVWDGGTAHQLGLVDRFGNLTTTPSPKRRGAPISTRPTCIPSSSKRSRAGSPACSPTRRATTTTSREMRASRPATPSPASPAGPRR